MKVLLDIKDDKAAFVLEVLKTFLSLKPSRFLNRRQNY